MRILSLLCGLLLAAASPALSTPEHSERTGQPCLTCHDDAEGGELSARGLQYAAAGYVWPPAGGYRVIGPVRKKVRIAVGMVHITAAFIWFGAILYVHIMLRPAYASRGLPRGEMALGMGSMVAVGVSGALLTLSRIRGVDVLLKSPWGRLLSLKIAIYVVMVCSALVVIFVVGPHLRKGRKPLPKGDGGEYGPEELSAFDGREGRPAYVARGGKVYDVSGLKLWRGGEHMKHRAGADLSDALGRAPHGAEKLEGLAVVGKYDALSKPKLSIYQKVFYFVAYMNLTLVFVVLAIIAFWRWGIY